VNLVPRGLPSTLDKNLIHKFCENKYYPEKANFKCW